MEQRYVIKFLQSDGYTASQIIDKLKDIYYTQALNRTQVYYWLAELRRGRTDLNDEPRSGRPPNDDLDDRIRACININPHASCRHIANQIGSRGSTVFRHLTLMGYKSMLLRWVPHILNDFQKKTRLSMAKIMLQKLQQLEHDQFQYIISGDESWFLYFYDHERQWVLDDDEICQRVESSHFQRKTMITLFIGINGVVLMKPKPQNQRINSEYFVNEILIPLEKEVNPSDAVKKRKKFYIHFDNARAHTSQYTKQYLDRSSFTLLQHPPYSPDLSPCDFGLFGTVKESFKGRSFDSEEELLRAIDQFFSEKLENFWQSIFEGWITRLRMCISANGDYF